jgi:hypothetical protein
MVLEKELLPYWTWLLGGPSAALPQFLITVLVLAFVGLVGGFLIAMVRHGPLKAGDITYHVVVNGLAELARTSPRRVWVLARLAVKESSRRRVAVALVIFLLILLFAAWFLKTSYQEPGKLYLSFVLTATTYLVLLIALLLSAFSLPAEFNSKTIYTVVTKPVRAGDIVLGRILGFTIVGTVLLLIMAVCSYAFVVRSLYHTHEIDISSLENIVDADGNVIGKKGRTTLDQYHRHEVELDADGYGHALSSNGHTHSIYPVQRAGRTEYRVSGPEGFMRARVPMYGRLRFLDRKGVEVARGISVGNEWTYRSFIDGGTSAAAIWTFDGVSKSMLVEKDGSKYLPLELIVRVFRSYKGNIEQGIQGSIQLRNPDTLLKSDEDPFTAKDASISEISIPTKLYANQKPIDLFGDLVTKDGRLEVIVQCLDDAQYFGFAQPDCYIRLPDGSPLWNYCKSQVSIWIQMVLVIAIGVTCSTFVNGPVAMMFTVSFITLGFFRDFFVKVATGQQVGGGPMESLVRLVTQKNMLVKLEDSFGIQLMHATDSLLKFAMVSFAYLLPDFRSFSTVDYVAFGFNIPADQIAQNLTVGFAFLLVLFVVGYFFLRTREVAK